MTDDSIDDVRDVPEDSEKLRAEVERLRAENEELKHASAGGTVVGWRWTGVVVLLIVGSLLLETSVAAVWLNRTIMDTERWVETVAPLADEPAIQDALATAVTDAVFEEVDVTEMAEEVLPDQLDFLAAPIGAQVEEWVGGLAERIVESEQFADVWREANRVGHAAFVAAATAEGNDTIQVDAGVIAVDTAPMVDLIQEEFEATAIGGVSNVIPWERLDTVYVLFESPVLGQVQRLLGWMSKLVWLFPLLSLSSLGGAVALAPDRRKAFMWLGIAVALGAALPLGGTYVGREFFAQAVASASGLDTTVGFALYDTILRFMLNALRSVAVLGVVIAVGSWVTGPSRPAEKLRGSVANMLNSAGSGVEFGALGAWVATRKALLRAAGVVVAIILLVLWETPTPGVIGGLTTVVLIWIALVELLGGEGEPSDDSELAPPQDSEAKD